MTKYTEAEKLAHALAVLRSCELDLRHQIEELRWLVVLFAVNNGEYHREALDDPEAYCPHCIARKMLARPNPMPKEQP